MRLNCASSHCSARSRPESRRLVRNSQSASSLLATLSFAITSSAAKALHLEYGKLKQLADASALRGGVAKGPTALRQIQSSTHRRSGELRRTRSKPRLPAFVELLAPRPGSSPECRVELEGPRGRMRIEFKGIATAELVALSRALWDSESARDQGEA